MYYLLMKKKNSKQWLGAIPIKKNVSKDKAKTIISNNIKKGYKGKIITSRQLQSLL